MAETLYLTPEEAFPDELGEMQNSELQVLDSRVQRQLDLEIIVDGEPNPETEFRHFELDHEFENREER